MNQRILDHGLKDESGNRYGRLVVVERSQKSTRHTYAYWVCQCDCGNQTVVAARNLRSGNTKSCGCLYTELTGLPYPSRKFADRNEAAFHRLFCTTRSKAKRRANARPWELTKEQFRSIITQPCTYCGAQPSSKAYTEVHDGVFIYNSLDRVDNTKGYIVDNVVPCCPVCNGGKSDKSVKEFLDWVERVYFHSIAKKST